MSFNLEGVIGGTVDYGSGKISDLADGYRGGNSLEFKEGRRGLALSFITAKVNVYQSTTDNWKAHQLHPAPLEISPVIPFLRGEPATFNVSFGLIFVYEDEFTVTNPYPILR